MNPPGLEDAGGQGETLRMRTRRLKLTAGLATRLARLEEPIEMAEAVVAELVVRSATSCPPCFEPATSDISRAWPRAAWPWTGLASGGRSPSTQAAVNSEIAVPIRVGERIWGVLDYKALRIDAFGDADAHVFQAVANQLGVASRAVGA